MNLLRMPIEIIGLITGNLSSDDIYNLSLACRALGYIIRDDGICRKALIHNANFSKECQDAKTSGSYAAGLRRLVKRRNAVKTARPFLVAVMAVCKTFMYANGALCYTVGQDHMRILLLEGRVTTELGVDTRQLLSTAVSGKPWAGSYKFKPLHYACGLVSCVYTYTKEKDGEPEHLLVLWQTETKSLVNFHRLQSTKRIFVRNNHKYLYYGTRSQDAEDGMKRWVIYGFDLSARQWLKNRSVLKHLAGDELGSNLCFEIIGDYFYGLSSVTTVAPEENKWNSFYCACRFQLGGHSQVQMLPKAASWRRRATDGAIDDRWSSLQLFEDEQTGRIYVYESRREWLPSSSQSQRNCYRKELLFPQQQLGEKAPHDVDDDLDGWGSEYFSPWDTQHHFETPEPENVHKGDDWSLGSTITYNNSLIRTYNPSCRCFVDLINEPPAAKPAPQRLLLRMRPKPRDRPIQASDAVEGLLSPTCCTSCGPGIPGQAEDGGIYIWPTEDHCDESRSLFTHLQHVMNPQQPAESMDWAADERFLIYSPKATLPNQLRAVVLISFDPALHLQAVPSLYECYPCEGCKRFSSYAAPCRWGKVQEVAACLPSSPETSHDAGKLGSGKAMAVQGSGPDQAGDDKQSTWATTSRAFYLTISGLDQRPRGFDMTHHGRLT
ncbi:hypothetical protein S7711_09220 [Stachybotrys chartarum IBT 7711]|uniref:F-box domain-containing protein n=1 Tax=Stachybotrys chartarum (strain CBS 109288 / IBT 7711) TaxID=1280523 RepID=A0A084ALC3_STACB|nr:hypothetical protein S7711_09220 [Stachybotrys chartarum IBT 7711]KFA46676.1 hypothetical protein S40293_08069 [Stachybotrys chartarum IBT 40293]